MKIDNIQNTKFGAVIYKPNSAEYVKTYLTARDKNVFQKASERFKNFKFWDLEITNKGMRVASKTSSHAFLIEDLSFTEPTSYKIRSTAIYDGYNSGIANGSKCEFFLEYTNNAEAINAYNKIKTLPYAEQAVELTEQLEKQQVINKYNTGEFREVNIFNFIKGLFRN